MDPLTHTLVGANLASTRLGQKTRLAAAALIIGANLPDVDAILYFTGHTDLALGFRRGWTHGILALVVLPLILTAILLVYGRLHGGQAPSPVQLLLLSTIAILTHPTLDWLNNYGMRWLMPFDGTWTYGDSVYIMDPWLWLILGCGWLAGRRPSATLIVVGVLVMLAIVWVVGRRSPSYFVVVGIVAVVLLLSLLWQPKAAASRRSPKLALIIATAYIVTRLLIHQATVREVRGNLGPIDRLMVAPHPIDPTRWDVVAQIRDQYRYGRYSWRTRTLFLAEDRIPLPKESPEWAAVRRDPSIRGFMTWVRYPWYEVERRDDETRVLVHDARYATRRGSGGFGGAVVVIPRHRP